jgi:hypothetical protein
MARNTAHTQTAQTPASAPARPTNPLSVAPAPRSRPTHEQIARRAYEIFLARGGAPGSPEQDWFQAERELSLGRQ